MTLEDAINHHFLGSLETYLGTGDPERMVRFMLASQSLPLAQVATVALEVASEVIFWGEGFDDTTVAEARQIIADRFVARLEEAKPEMPRRRMPF